MSKRLLNYFLQGLILIAPIAITLWAVWAIVVTVDRWIDVGIPGAGFVITVALITVVGFLASSFLTRGAIALVERVLTRLPFVRLLYSSTKDLLNAFVGEKRRFDTPVLVSVFPGSEARALGFVTQESLRHLGLEDHVAVYFPQSYNFAGQLLLFPRASVRALDARSADVLAFIVSGGVSGMGELPVASRRSPVASSARRES